MNAPPSLRDLYSDSGSAWAFTPPNASQPSAIPVAPEPSTSSSRPVQWSNRPTHNSIFDLSPSLDPNDPAGMNPSDLFRAILASTLLQYTSSAIAMPWEVGKLLLQVQWVPRDTGMTEQDFDLPDEESSDESNDEDNDSYFADPNITPKVSHTTRVEDPATRKLAVEDTDHVIPVGSADGVWGMIKRITRFRGEGWLALWKGLLTSCVSDVLHSTMQPFFQSLLQSIFLQPASPFYQPPLFVPVASHIITGFLLSPLDLARTRLVVQSSREQTYTGPIDALSKAIQEEGGVKGIYLHPQLLIPTIIDSALRPLVSMALPGLLASYLGAAHITEDTNPIAWGFAELAGSCVGLLITLPFETVRRRLQVQTRGRARPIKGCVQLRPAPYNGVVDAFWHILTEERSDLPILHHRRPSKVKRRDSKGKQKEGESAPSPDSQEEEGLMRNTGIGQLYRGLGMRLGASVIVFLLTLVSGEDRSDGGWAEL